MCGILAYIDLNNSRSLESFSSALDLLAHRGPNAKNIQDFSGKRSTYFLGHTRLAIFDLSPLGSQPMSDSRGRTIVYNGEIFNWPEIRSELESKGYKFNSQTDTEVILAAYDYWGINCVKYFNGFWSFIILTKLNNGTCTKSFISRDRFGIKPLYYYRNEKQIIFSSEIKPIWKLLDAQPEINACELARLLVYDQSHDSESTIYNNIFEILPSHNYEFNLHEDTISELQRTKYWELQDAETTIKSSNYYLDEFSDLIEDSVKIRFRSDREVALTLSGGIDSSIIAIAARKGVDTNIKAFSSYFPNDLMLDESHFAKVVANKCQLHHVLVQPSLDELASDEYHLTVHQEMMYTSFSMLVNWLIHKEIKRNGIPVVLNGQGGDELFIGYDRYIANSLYFSLPNLFAFAKETLNICKNSAYTPLKLLKALVYFNFPRLREWQYMYEARGIFRKEFLNNLENCHLPHFRSLTELQLHQICGEQLRRLLRYDDRTSSAFGIEARPPFLDHRLVQFAISLPSDQKVKDGWTKYILRRYLASNGLPEIAWRKQKYGFAAPTNTWARILLSQSNSDLLRSHPVKNLFKSEFNFTKLSERNVFKIYNLISTSTKLSWSDLK